MLGDTYVTLPSDQATLGVTIETGPGVIWPWLLQMGYRRGGLYSYDWLDRLFGYLDRPSADRILPQWQHLRVGDQIPIGRGGAFPVRAIEPNRSLVLGGWDHDVEWSWEFQLTPQADGSTRLVSRNRIWTRRTFRSRLTMLLMKPAAFIMTRKMLLGIKQRAESAKFVSRAVAA